MSKKFDIKVLKWRDHAMTKEMWAGALTPTQESDRMGVFLRETEGGELVPKLASLAHTHMTPALLQIVMEVLTNASDHHRDMVRLGGRADQVRRIDVTFNAKTGTFAVENDGLGIPITLHKSGTDHVGFRVRMPEVVFAIPLAGGNMQKPEDSVKGGTNGLGAKLANVHSVLFRFETVGANVPPEEDEEVVPEQPGDPPRDGSLYGYVQVFRDRAGTRAEPQLYDLKSAAACAALSSTKPHTLVKFRPAYEALGHKGDLALAHIAADLEAWARWQVYLLAAYVGPKVAVSFNGERCGITSAEALARFYVETTGVADVAQLFPFTVKAAAEPQKSNPWQVVAAILPGKPVHVGVVNGVYCCKGTHVKYLRNLIGAKAADRMQKLAAAKKGAKAPTITDACRYLSLFFVAPIPGAAWNAQNKRNLQIPVRLLKPYTAPATKLNQIGTALAEYSAALAEYGTKRKTRKAAGKKDKYFPARKAGGAQSARCTLLAAEGDSAIRLLQAGLTLGKKNPGGPSFEYYGIFSLGGVIMNALRNVKPVLGPEGRTCLIRSKSLQKNKVLNALVDILGLSYANTYEDDAELATLNYGAIIVATDQDLDGTGKILPLVALFFHTFWPALLRRGYVRRYYTPVTRAYPKAAKGGSPLEFYYENEFERWVAGVDAGKYAISYYKGLAAHSSKEVFAMFRRFGDNVSRFVYDADAARNFVDFFGEDTAARKAILATPVAWAEPAAEAAARAAHVSECSHLMLQDAKAYKLDAISRNIPCFTDGLMVARRKILAGAIKYFTRSNAKKKVFQLGGYIADHMAYHHGSDPLNGGIIRLAQRFPGANNYPYLAGLGMFGTRHAGGKDAGSPRYVNVRLARPYVAALFPPQDTWLLPHVFEDGERAQPQYFLPVLPTALLETAQIPSEGWAFKTFARDLADVVRLVRAYAGGHELVARVGGAAEAHPECASLADLARAGHVTAADVRALRKDFPLGTSLHGYGEHLSPEERTRLLRVRETKAGKRYLASYGAYTLEEARGRVVVHVTELPISRSTDSFKEGLDKLTHSTKNPKGLIQGYVDESPTLTIDIRVTLVADGLAKVRSKCAKSDDPVAEYLGLHDSLSPYLNLYTPEGTVREFDGDYRAALFAWAPLRRDLYRERFERAAVLLALRAELERETVRYIDEVAGGAASVAKLADEDAADAALAARGHPAFDAGLLREPRYTPTADLERLVREGPGASRGYLLNLRERDLLRAARDRRHEKVGRLEAERAAAESSLAEKPFAGASTWLAEVDAVLAAVAAGEKCGWWSEE